MIGPFLLYQRLTDALLLTSIFHLSVHPGTTLIIQSLIQLLNDRPTLLVSGIIPSSSPWVSPSRWLRDTETTSAISHVHIFVPGLLLLGPCCIG